MLTLDPNDPEELAFALKKAVRQSQLSLKQIADRFESDYGETLSTSAKPLYLAW